MIALELINQRSKHVLKEEALNHADGDRITPRKHAIGDETEAVAKDEEPWYSNLTDGGCEAKASVDYKRSMTSLNAWMSTPMNMMKKESISAPLSRSGDRLIEARSDPKPSDRATHLSFSVLTLLAKESMSN
ncbi:hypothetical protein HPP92_028512 [Vanilla planifolia]|uniref:Uncharacterized protein n=1 Tax=Vanilla planifolia TaxID=51239 RepID=A0A835U3J4_VANPL|nr:hypothetical protein HPP92_028512 [Vanilla planifolia]